MQLKQLSRNVLYEHSKLLEHFTIYVIQTHMIKVNYITVKWSSYKKQNLECQFFFNIYHPNACIITPFSPSEVETVAGESGKFKRLVNLQSLYSVTLKRFETNKSDPMWSLNS